MPCVDCANLTPAAARVARGGSTLFSAPTLRNGSRNALPVAGRYDNVGIRCARRP